MEYSKNKLGHNMSLTYYTYILFIIFWLTQNCILQLSRTKQNIMGIVHKHIYANLASKKHIKNKQHYRAFVYITYIILIII